MRFGIAVTCATIALTGLKTNVVSAQLTCGPDAAWNIAGSSTVEPIAIAWAKGYMEMCPGVTVNVSGGGSTTGARAVCNTTGSPAEIGNMSREWRVGSEVNVTDARNRKYVCNSGDIPRTVTQVDVAIDGITIAVVNGGIASKCLRSLEGRGLNIDQLRWIYSNFTAEQLTATGWDRNSVPHRDGTEFTHFFDELSENVACRAGEIRLAAPGSLSGTFDFFREAVLTAPGEGFATTRPTGIFFSEDDSALVNFLLTSSSSEELFGDSICFFGYSYFVAEGSFLYGVPIQAKGSLTYFSPSFNNIESGVYKPFSRRIYMNVYDGASESTGPFISYGLSQEGIKAITDLGFVPPPRDELPSILARIGREPSPTSPPTRRPTRAPVSGSPISSPVPVPGRCGVLRLSIFCPRSLCGIFGRIMGLCSL